VAQSHAGWPVLLCLTFDTVDTGYAMGAWPQMQTVTALVAWVGVLQQAGMTTTHDGKQAAMKQPQRAFWTLSACAATASPCKLSRTLWLG
jgi:Flp pilus assembly protein TadG